MQALEPWDELTGHAHGVLVLDDGTRVGVADPRSDGSAEGLLTLTLLPSVA